jgi:hypothetical protein
VSWSVDSAVRSFIQKKILGNAPRRCSVRLPRGNQRECRSVIAGRGSCKVFVSGHPVVIKVSWSFQCGRDFRSGTVRNGLLKEDLRGPEQQVAVGLAAVAWARPSSNQ